MDISELVALSAFCATLYFGILRLGWLGPIKMFYCFSILTLVWGWLGGLLPINLRNLQIAILLPLFYLIFKNTKTSNSLNWKEPLVAILPIFLLGMTVLRSNANLFFQILTSGYDHNGHIAHFYRTYVNNGFAFGANPNLVSGNAILESGYPPLQMGSWAFTMRVFGFTANNPAELVNMYVFFNLLTYFFIGYVLLLSFSKIPSIYLRVISIFGAVFLLLATKLSTLLVSGFPPTYFGVAVILCGLYLIKVSANLYTRVNIVALTMLLVLYSYQLFALALIPAIISILIQLKKTRFSEIKTPNIIVILLCSLFVLPLIPISKQITSYVWDFGGIERPDFWSISLIFLLLIVSFMISRTWDLNEFTGVFTIVIALTMILYAKKSQVGEYYSIKLLYLGLFLALLSIPGIMIKIATVKSPLKIPIYFAVFSLCLLSNQSALKAPFIDSNLVQVANSILVIDKSIGDPCANKILAYAKEIDTFGDFNSYSYIGTKVENRDLRTRWLNSLNGKMTNPVFDISIPLGTSESEEDIVSAWKLKYPFLHLDNYNLEDSECLINP
jgi:hypothetical protein